MKNSFRILLAAALLLAGFTAEAQTNAVTVTNYVTIYTTNDALPVATSSNWNWLSGIETVGSDIASATNIAIIPYGTVLTSGAAKGTVGAGLLALYDINNYVGTGIGIDWLGQLDTFSGNVQLKLPTHPLAGVGFTNFVMTPLIIVGLGTPLSGAGTANGSITSISSLGDDFTFASAGGWNFGLGAAFGVRTGAGKYSGDALNGFFSMSHGF
jgi:hypothetical protein